MRLELERRTLSAEVRANQPDKTIQGYAAVYGERTMLWQGFYEEIAAGAFDADLAADPDVVALWQHNMEKPLGRTTAGTLALGSDEKGLRYSAKLPNTTWGNDAFESVTRGDVRQSSFGFYVKREEFVDLDGGDRLRIVREASLVDVSPVTFPAYTGTEATAKLAFRNAPAGTDPEPTSSEPDPEEKPKETDPTEVGGDSLRLARQANLELAVRVSEGGE